jgi:hypothetical protein
LGHAQLTTTQIYTSAPIGETIASILAHHARRATAPSAPALIAPEYRPESLGVLFPGAARGPRRRRLRRWHPRRAAISGDLVRIAATCSNCESSSRPG